MDTVENKGGLGYTKSETKVKKAKDDIDMDIHNKEAE